MALETATYIDGLVATNPAGGDAIAQADDHLRLIKSTLKATFPNVTGPVTVTQDDINGRGIPSGGIIMWSGAQSAIPAGWVLCNGANSTPDLRGRFVLGAGGAYGVGAIGGASTKSLYVTNLPSHSHGASSTSTFYGNPIGSHSHTVNDPGHSHTYKTYGIQNNGASGNGNTNTDWGYPQTAASYTGISLASTYIGAPTGSVTTNTTVNATGGGEAFDIMNPYYALCFIMKV